MSARIRRSLTQVDRQATGLGRPTIMDRALAAEHGVEYVHLAAFAIDIDRAFMADQVGGDPLPFAWEVFLVLAYVLGRVDSGTEPGRALLEDTALHVLAADPGEPQLGGVIAFALQQGVERGLLDDSLGQVFRSWRSAPKQLRKALDAHLAAPRSALLRFASHALSVELTPPLSPPTRATLQEMVEGTWPLAL